MMVGWLLSSFLASLLLKENAGIKMAGMPYATQWERSGSGLSEHPWPNPFGKEQHGTTSEILPSLSTIKPAWNWTFPTGRYSTVFAGGPVVDNTGNFYVVSQNAVHKIGSDGQAVWSQEMHPINNMVHLYEDKVLGSTADGYAFALGTKTGQLVWSTKLADSAGGDSGYPAQHDGIFVVGAEASQNPTGEHGGNARVHGLDSNTGAKIWEFSPKMPVWNFSPLFPGDDTTVFMDLVGNVYKLHLRTGELIWKTLSHESDQTTYSDGGAILGTDFMYTCSNINDGHGAEGSRGAVRAYSLSDGKRKWEQILPQPCNSYPAVGKLSGRNDLSVVVTPGSFIGTDVIHGGFMAFDAITGARQWQFQCPIWYGKMAKNDFVGRPCIPAHWSAPVITANGKVVAERIDGLLYVVEDTMHGHREPVDPVAPTDIDFETTPGVKAETFDAERSSLHGALAFAPKTMAFTTCDSLIVFKY